MFKVKAKIQDLCLASMVLTHINIKLTGMLRDNQDP